MDKKLDGLSMSEKQFSALSEDEDKLFIICMETRPGMRLFLVDLEYNKFIPGTPLNDRFELFINKWEGIGWAVVAVPMKYKDFVWEVAERNGMRVADGIPMTLGNEGSVSFPLAGDNVFTLENATNSKLYNGAVDDLERDENEKCDVIISEHLRTLGEMCSKCGCFHDDTFEKKHHKEAVQLRKACAEFDPQKECMLCRYPVERLSMGGPDICSWCDCGQDPKVSLENRHAHYRNQAGQ